MEWMLEHSLLLLLGAALLFTVWWLYSQRARLRLHPALVPLLAAAHVAVGVGCVKLFAVLEAGSLRAAGSMSLFGAVFFLPLCYALGARLSRRKAGAVFDVFAVPMVFTLACARVNCLISGCCYGLPIPGTALRWPTREAELVFYALILAWMLLRTRRADPGGKLYPVYMAAYGLFRFVTEFFRHSEAGGLLHLSHLWAVLCCITGLSIWMELNRREHNQSVVKPNHRRNAK